MHLPRYKFQWANLPEAVLRGLAHDLDLTGEDPADALKSAVGARPTDTFVQAAWSSLREHWLGKDRTARQLIVEELWQLGLGDDSRPTTRDQEMAFLRGRNNARRLREVVLDTLISTGQAHDEVAAGGNGPATTAILQKRPDNVVIPTPPPAPRPADPPADAPVQTAPQGLADLERRLWGAANALRGPVDPADFKTYVFPILFWKWISDSWDYEHGQAIKQYGDDVEPEVEADFHRFSLPVGTHWRAVTTKTANLGSQIATALAQIEQANQTSLAGIFGDAAWGNKERLPESSLVALIDAFNGLALNPEAVAHDVLGQAYEYLLKNFADESGKKAGEFFTPRQVVRLIVQMLDPQPGESIYDPAAGSGGMLVETINTVRAHGDTRTLRLYGQEVNLTTSAIARMNLFLHEIEDFAGRAAHVKTLLLNPERIKRVCTDIVDHYDSKIAPLGTKAQVVAFDRELVVAYHQEITRLLTERGSDRTSAVVMTVGTAKNEPAEWRKYALDRAAEARLKQRFTDPDDPLSFLIVTAKLLTGFDAPVEQVMYLDRPLRRHTLFQAITRTNRRFTQPRTGQEKRHGLIVDYIGLGNQIARALKAADPDRGGKRPVEVDDLVAEFEATLTRTLTRFEGVDRADHSFAALQAAMERFPGSEARDAYARDFTAVQTLWEFLDPHEALHAHVADYKWLAQVYEAIKPTKVSDALLWHRLGAKTLALVHGHMSAVEVSGSGIEEIVVDPEAIEAMRALVEQGELDLDPNRDLFKHPVTVEEVLDTIDARIQRRLATRPHPFYQSLAEQIDRLRQQAIRKAEDSVDFLRQALEVARLAVQAERMEAEGTLDQAEHLLDPHFGALTQIVDQYKPAGTPVIVDDVVRDIDTIVKQVRFTGWNETQEGDRTVRKELRQVLKKYGLPLTGPLFDNAYGYVRENY